MSNDEKYAKSHGIPMFGNGREDTTMKHLSLIVIGFILSFLVSVVFSSFSAWLLPTGAYLRDLRTIFPMSRYFSVIGVFLVPSILLTFSIFARRTAQNNEEVRNLQRSQVIGCFVGLIYLIVVFFNKIGEEIHRSGTLGDIAVFFVLGILGVATAIFYLGFLTSVFLANVGVVLYIGYHRERVNYQVFSILLFTFFCTIAFLTYKIIPSLETLQSIANIKAQRNFQNKLMLKYWADPSDSNGLQIHLQPYTENGFVAEYSIEFFPDGKPCYLWRRVYNKNKKLIIDEKFSAVKLEGKINNNTSLNCNSIAQQLLRYSHKEISQEDLIEWSHCVLLAGNIKEDDSRRIIFAVGRIGLVDVPEFGMSEKVLNDYIAIFSQVTQ